MSKKHLETLDERKKKLVGGFNAIRSKTKLSIDDFAKLLGYARASSLQRYGSLHEHSGRYIGGLLMERMLEHLPGRFGITEAEVRALGGPLMAEAGNPANGARLVYVEAAGLSGLVRQARLQRGMSVANVAQKTGIPESNLVAVETGIRPVPEQELAAIASTLNVDLDALRNGRVEATDGQHLGDVTVISDLEPKFAGPRDVEKLGVIAAGDDGDFAFNGEPSEYVARPRGLIGRPGVFALEIISESMYPAHRKGDVVFCDRQEPMIGEDVMIETFPEEGASVGKAFLKRLKRRTKSVLVVEQFNPAKDITFDPYEVKRVWRVVPNRELHGY